MATMLNNTTNPTQVLTSETKLTNEESILKSIFLVTVDVFDCLHGQDLTQDPYLTERSISDSLSLILPSIKTTKDYDKFELLQSNKFFITWLQSIKRDCDRVSVLFSAENVSLLIHKILILSVALNQPKIIHLFFVDWSHLLMHTNRDIVGSNDSNDSNASTRHESSPSTPSSPSSGAAAPAACSVGAVTCRGSGARANSAKPFLLRPSAMNAHDLHASQLKIEVNINQSYSQNCIKLIYKISSLNILKRHKTANDNNLDARSANRNDNNHDERHLEGPQFDSTQVIQMQLNLFDQVKRISETKGMQHFKLSYLNHASLLGHKWMILFLIQNGAWKAFFDGSSLVFLLVLIDHVRKSGEVTGSMDQTTFSRQLGLNNRKSVSFQVVHPLWNMFFGLVKCGAAVNNKQLIAAHARIMKNDDDDDDACDEDEMQMLQLMNTLIWSDSRNVEMMEMSSETFVIRQRALGNLLFQLVTKFGLFGDRDATWCKDICVVIALYVPFIDQRMVSRLKFQRGMKLR